MTSAEDTREALLAMVETLQTQLTEAKDTLRAIAQGDVDAIVIPSTTGRQVYTLTGADEVYRRLINEMTEGALTLTPAGQILYANATFARMVGAPLEAFIGTAVQQFIVAADLSRFNAFLQQGALDTLQAEIALSGPHGTPVPVLLSLNRLQMDAAEMLCLIVTDLTRVRQTEQALRDSEERFRLLAEQTNDLFWFIGLEPERILYVSPAYERLWGRPVEELYRNPRTWLAHIHPEDQPRVGAAFAALVDGNSDGQYDEEYRVLRSNGSLCWVHSRGLAIRDGDGQVIRLGGIAQDVTAQHRAQQEILELNESLRHHADQLQVAMQEIQGNSAAQSKALDLLYVLMNPLSETRALQPVLDDALAKIMAALEIEAGAIALFEDEKEGYSLSVSHGFSDATRLAIRQGAWVAAAQEWLQTSRARHVVLDLEHAPDGPQQVLATAGFRSVAILPLRISEQLLGLMTLASRDPERLGLIQEALLTAIAHQVSTTIENTRLYHESEERTGRLVALARLNRIISSSLDTHEVLHEIASAATELMGDTYATFWIADEATQILAHCAPTRMMRTLRSRPCRGCALERGRRGG